MHRSLQPFGLVGVVTGIESVYYLDAGRFSGDDYTGLAAIPGGLVLIAVGATTLWRVGCQNSVPPYL